MAGLKSPGLSEQDSMPQRVVSCCLEKSMYRGPTFLISASGKQPQGPLQLVSVSWDNTPLSVLYLMCPGWAGT